MLCVALIYAAGVPQSSPINSNSQILSHLSFAIFQQLVPGRDPGNPKPIGIGLERLALIETELDREKRVEELQKKWAEARRDGLPRPGPLRPPELALPPPGPALRRGAAQPLLQEHPSPGADRGALHRVAPGGPPGHRPPVAAARRGLPRAGGRVPRRRGARGARGDDVRPGPARPLQSQPRRRAAEPPAQPHTPLPSRNIPPPPDPSNR